MTLREVVSLAKAIQSRHVRTLSVEASLHDKKLQTPESCELELTKDQDDFLDKQMRLLMERKRREAEANGRS